MSKSLKKDTNRLRKSKWLRKKGEKYFPPTESDTAKRKISCRFSRM